MARASNPNNELTDAVALLLVDMQDVFLSTIEEADTLVRRCSFAIEAAQIFGIKVIFTEQVPDKLGRTNQKLTGVARHPRFFSKSSFTALQANGLTEYLKKEGIYHLLVAGVETPICIYQTALHAVDSDIDVTLLSDCIGSRRPEDDAFVLPALTKMGCHLLPSESVFYSLLGDSRHPRFRSFSELVKSYDGRPTAHREQDQRRKEAPKQTAAESAPAEAESENEVEPAPATAQAAPAEHGDEQHRSESGGSGRRRRRGRRGGSRRGKGGSQSGDNQPAGESPATESQPTAPEEKREPQVEQPPAPESKPDVPKEPQPEPAPTAVSDESASTDSNDSKESADAPKKKAAVKKKAPAKKAARKRPARPRKPRKPKEESEKSAESDSDKKSES